MKLFEAIFSVLSGLLIIAALITEGLTIYNTTYNASYDELFKVPSLWMHGIFYSGVIGLVIIALVTRSSRKTKRKRKQKI